VTYSGGFHWERLRLREERWRARAKQRHLANQQTPRYKKLREARLQIAGNKGEGCGGVERLQLHHLHYETLGRERLHDVRILCDTCHEAEGRPLEALKRARWRP